MRLRLLIASLVPIALPVGVAAQDSPVVGIPDPSGATPAMTLRECVDLALEENAALESERLRLGELRGRGWQTMSDGTPSLEIAGSVNHGRDPSFLLDSSFGGDGDSSFLPPPEALPAQTFYRLNGNVSWEINPKRLYDSWKGVQLSLDQYQEDFAAARNGAIESTMGTFYELVLHQERIASLEAEIAARREFLEISRRRFQLDLVTELDTLQAAVSLANLGPSLRRARKDLRNTTSSLNILMGRAAMAPLAVVPVDDVELDPIDVDGAMALALERPEIRSLELDLELLKKARGVYKADQWPAVRAFGQYGYVGRDTGTMFDDGHDFWNVDVALAWPFFDGFFTYGRVKEVNASIARAEEELVEGKRQAQLRVATAIEELEAARANLAAAELNQAAAESALQQMTLRFNLGQASNLDVLNSQSDRFSARSNLIQARFDVLLQTAVLKRAIGVDPSLTIPEIVQMFEGSSP